MKKIIIVLVGMYVSVVWGQNNPEIKTELPNIIPPSPSVAALMKFEEIPVSNYTGVPDIRVPLFNLEIENDLNLSLNLTYNPLNVKVKDKSTEIGLGWSLMGLGSISRTVIDYPDEYWEPEKKIGIYHKYLGYGYDDYISEIESSGFLNNYTQNDYKWNKKVKNIIDTQHDIWQFNFFGNSGRFIIKKLNNNLVIVPLDNNNLKIYNTYSPLTNNLSNSYIPLSFRIIDENGYEYFFTEIETTRLENSSSTKGFFNSEFNQNLNSLYSYNSAFHLTQIKLQNKLLLQVNYDTGQGEDIFESNTIINYNPYINNLIGTHNLANTISPGLSSYIFPNEQETNSSIHRYNAKKIYNVIVPNKFKINFEYNFGREDYSYSNQLKYLKHIILKDFKDNFIEKIVFSHQYHFAPTKKLFLKSISKENNNLQLPFKEFEYDLNIDAINLFEDDWGYITDNNNRITNKQLAGKFTLNKIKSLTGGYTTFEYEANTFSNIKGNEIENFEENLDNWNSNQGFSNYINQFFSSVNCFSITDNRNKVKLELVNMPSLIGDWALELHKDGIFYEGISNSNNINLFKEIEDLPIGNYSLVLNSFNIGSILNPNITRIKYNIMYLKPINERYEYLYGAGHRIKSIKNFKNNNDISHIKNYYYSYFDNLRKSSGSTNSNLPISKYYTPTKTPKLVYSYQAGASSMVIDSQDLNYQTNSNSIIFSSQDSNFVGYKNVTEKYEDENYIFNPISNNIENENLGKKQFTYTSSIDFPDGGVSSPHYNFNTQTQNFKRGLLLKESVYNKNNNLIVDKLNEYEYIENSVKSGLYFYSNFDQSNRINPICFLFSNYNHLVLAKTTGLSGFYDYLPDEKQSIFNNLEIYPFVVSHKYGWSKLIKTTTNEYFGNNTLKTETKFGYNIANKKINYIETKNSNGIINQKNIQYNLSTENLQKNRLTNILYINEKVNNVSIGTKEIEYFNFPNYGFALPKSIKTSKGSNFTETKIKFNNYDTHGNALEVQQENGMLISYIYAYNHTLPVAKIENMAYSSIPLVLITAIQNATDTGTYSEATLKTALDNLRNHASLSNAMVSTYIHKPLIGISSATDPKGDTQTYHYDSFNRLQFVKDKNGNILSENQYHYRP